MKYTIPPKAMVLYVLGMYPGEPLSIKQIQEKIIKHFEYPISWQTCADAIKEQDFVTGNIIESSERRGKFNLPTKVYTVQVITQDH